ncbi:hypothetical protein Q5H93_06290 [Hymenobacter sp. ASUV-10]|uniref:Leucine-rich repeat domain-containing protein n=1 Tax=Hymenobacter aranciens TaxID=3063996 RepID=A0ABT9B7T7_9BACT|nr:hypothetical protein [Hymenobacter sp. ASUV-10]MDO7874335.1 hypothetical protein [Hymenobacter sp. ASUV-10]
MNKLLRVYFSDGATTTAPLSGNLGVSTVAPTQARSFRNVYSDGEEVWGWAGNTGKVVAAGTGRYVDMYAAGVPAHITTLTSLGTGIVSINSPEYGVLDFTGMTSLTGMTLYYVPLKKVIGNFNNTAPFLRFSGYAGTLDLSECLGLSAIYMPSNSATDIIWPPVVGNSITFISLSGQALVNKDVAVPAYPAVNNVDLSSYNQRALVNQINVSNVPTVTTLQLNGAGVKSLVYASGWVSVVKSLNLGYCRFSYSTYSGDFYGNGVDTGLLPLLTNALNLTALDLTYNGFSGTELSAVINTIHANRASRIVGAKTLKLEIQDIGYAYPATGQVSGIRFSNDAIVDVATRSKIADLTTTGWTVTYNRPVMTASYVPALGPTSLRLTFYGDKNIDIWAANDTVSITSSQYTAMLPNGNYQIAQTSPGGKVWDIVALPGNTPLNVASNTTNFKCIADKV